MHKLMSVMASNMAAAERKINWEVALNPNDDNWNEYSDAASHIIEPDTFNDNNYEREELQEELDEFYQLSDDIDKWKGFIHNVIAMTEMSPNWIKLVDVVIENGY